MTEEEKIPGAGVLTSRDILDMLPHRYPFLLVDKIAEITADERAVGIKNVTNSEPWFTGHFPHMPVFPGVLIIEALAQTAAVLALHHSRVTGGGMTSDAILLMAVDKARFRHPVVPGDQMRLEVEKRHNRGMTYRFYGQAFVGTRCVAEAVIMATNHEPE